MCIYVHGTYHISSCSIVPTGTFNFRPSDGADTICGRVLFEGGFYSFHHCDGRPGRTTAHATTTHTEWTSCRWAAWHPPSIAAMIMKDDEVVALAMFPMRAIRNALLLFEALW